MVNPHENSRPEEVGEFKKFHEKRCSILEQLY